MTGRKAARNRLLSLLDPSFKNSLGKCKPVNAKKIEVDLLSNMLEVKETLNKFGKVNSIKSGMALQQSLDTEKTFRLKREREADGAITAKEALQLSNQLSSLCGDHGSANKRANLAHGLLEIALVGQRLAASSSRGRAAAVIDSDDE